MEEQEVRELIFKLQQYQAQVDILSRQNSMVQASIDEHESAIDAIKHCKDLEERSKILVPLGAGSFIHATLDKVDKILVGLGANVSAEQTPDQAIEYISKRKDEMNEMLGQLDRSMHGLEQEIQSIQIKLAQYEQEQRGASQTPG